jgi:hypothetical protein
MPNPITTYSAIKALWNESKPLRNWLWGKLPIVKDLKKRDVIEGHLARLLDDANKLAQALPSDIAETKISERVELFRKEIAKEGVTGEEANALVERANLLARLMVTGPLGDVIDLRFRLAEDEEALQLAERSIENLVKQVSTLESRANHLESQTHRLVIFLAISATASVFALLAALAALVSHR